MPIDNIQTNAVAAKGAALASSSSSAIKYLTSSTRIGEKRDVVPFSKIHQSPLNPRKTFDKDAVAQIAESIFVEGVLQNLVVRHHPKIKDEFEIVSGETRWRGIELLVQAKRVTKDFGVPVVIRMMKDDEVIALALMENLHRKDLTPLEEARGYDALRKQKLTTAQIAERTKVTQRQIQLRLALVDKLAPEAQKALEKGEINAQVARKLVQAPIGVQSKALKELMRDDADDRTGAAVEEILHRAAIPVNRALFDVTLYTKSQGATITDEASGNVTHFADEKLFKKLQQEFVDAKIAELKKAGKTRILVLGDSEAGVKVANYFSDYHWHKNEKSDKASTILEIKNEWSKGVKLVVHHNMVEGAGKSTGSSAATKGGKAPKADPLDNFTQAHFDHASVRKTHMLQAEIANDATLAMKVAVISLLGAGGDVVEVKGRMTTRTVEPKLMEKLKAALASLPKDVRASLFDMGETGAAWSSTPVYERDMNAVWDFVFKLRPDPLQKLFTLLVAVNVATKVDRDGDQDATIAFHRNSPIAAMPICKDDCTGLRKPALQGVCKEIKTTYKETMTGKQLTDIVTGELKKKASTYILPTLRIGNGEALAKGAKQLAGA